MATIEDELLALAGESSDDEGNKAMSDAGAAEQSDSDAADAAIATAPTPRKKRAGRKKKEESEDDGEASGLSDAVPDTSKISDDEGARSDTSGPLFPVEGKFYSQKDKAEIMALPEIEREAKIEERVSLMIRRQQDSALKRLAQEKKRKASAAETEESLKKRKLPGGRVSAALESYKASREKKGQRQTLTVDDARLGRDVSESVSRGGDDDSEVEWDTGRDKSAGPYDEPAEYVDFYRAQVTRGMMAQHCFFSGFNKTVSGCYARIACPPERPGGPAIYRMSKIETVKDDGKSYEVEGTSGVRFSINKWLVTSVGKSKKDFPTINCSNDRITVNEFNDYRLALENAGLNLPKKSYLSNKNKELLKMVEHTLTQEEVDEKLRKSGVAGRKQKQIQIQVLRRELEAARASHDEAKISKLESELQALGDNVTDSPRGSQAAPLANGEKDDQKRLAELNRKARKENAENVRRAQMKDLQRNAERRAAQTRAAKAAAANGDAVLSQESSSQVNGGDTNGTSSQTLASLMRGDHDNDEPQPGRVDFRKYDAIWQFGTLSRKKGSRKSVFKRTLFRAEMIGALDLGVDMSGLDL